MANTISLVTNLTYGGNDLQRADLSLHFDIEEGLDELAEFRGEDRIMLGEVGMYEGNRKATRRAIVLKGWIKATTAAGYRNRVQNLHTYFNPASPGNLVATLEDGTTATIRARVDAIVPVGERTGGGRGFRVVMHSIVPNWTIS